MKRATANFKQLHYVQNRLDKKTRGLLSQEIMLWNALEILCSA